MDFFFLWNFLWWLINTEHCHAPSTTRHPHGSAHQIPIFHDIFTLYSFHRWWLSHQHDTEPFFSHVKTDQNFKSQNNARSSRCSLHKKNIQRPNKAEHHKIISFVYQFQLGISVNSTYSNVSVVLIPLGSTSSLGTPYLPLPSC